MGLVQRLKGLTGFTATGVGRFLSPSDNTSTAPNPTVSAAKALANAYKNPVVCAVVEWITTQASPTPMYMEQAVDEDTVEVVRQHPLLDLLKTPSPFMSGRELLSVSFWDMLLLGQTFWHKDRSADGAVVGLTFLPGRLVTVKGSKEQLVTNYEYRPEGTGAPIIYEPEDVVHIRLEPNPFDPKNGLSPLVCVADFLMIDSKTTDYTSDVLNGPGGPGGLLMPPENQVLTPEVAKASQEYLDNNFTGRHRGKLGLLRAHMTYVPTALDPHGMLLRTIQDTSETRICGVLGVHPIIVGLLAGSAQSRVGAATKELERAAWTNRVIPLQETISEQIDRQLVPEFIDPPEAEQWSLEWDRSGVLSLQPDMLQEAQRWSLLMRSGISDRFDAKTAQGMEADDNDRYYVLPVGMQLIPSDGPPPAPAIVPEPPEPAPDDGEAAALEDRSASAWVVRAFPYTKAELTDDQRRMLLALADDAERLEGPFRDDLLDAFEELGRRAEAAFWEVESVETMRHGRWSPARVKQGPVDPDQIGRDVALIIRRINIEEWTSQVTLPLFNQHYLRVLNTTASTVGGVLNIAVDIPDPVGRRIVAEGGTRLGLIDVSGQTRDSIFQELFEGRSNGEGPAQLARRIRDRVPAGPFRHAGSRYRAHLIARTETKNGQNLSTLESYRAARNVTAVLVIDARLGDTDAACEGVDGSRLTFDEADALGALEHPNCSRSFSPIVD